MSYLTENGFQALREANVERQAEWDPEKKIDIAYRGNELAGEVGEACNVIKKIERERRGIRGSRDTTEHLAEELADVIVCVDLIAAGEGIDLWQAVRTKFNITSEKVGFGNAAMSFNVTIEVIDHKDQAYETTGDWGFIREPAEEGKLGSKKPLSLWIKVSRTGDWRYEMLVAVHEFVEAILCEHDGVYEDRVNAFDIEFEKERLPGTDDEPGDDKAAPYFYQHQIASMVERLVALMIGVDWNDYCDANAVLNPKSSLNE